MWNKLKIIKLKPKKMSIKIPNPQIKNCETEKLLLTKEEKKKK